MNIENYIKQAKEFFENIHDGMASTNHQEHDANQDYWDILLGDIKKNPLFWEGKNALDFGCGCGRNMKNLCSLASWRNVHGCDISKNNALFSEKFAQKHNARKSIIRAWENDGSSIKSMDGSLPYVQYDFVMTTVVLEHIPSWTIRQKIFKSIYENMSEYGLFSFSISNLSTTVEYHVDHFEFPMNAKINYPDKIKEDLEVVGFKNVFTFSDSKFEGRDWTFVKAYK